LGQFLISSWSKKGHEPSRAENPSARAMARASSARTHHYWIEMNTFINKRKAGKSPFNCNIRFFSKTRSEWTVTNYSVIWSNVHFQVYFFEKNLHLNDVFPFWTDSIWLRDCFAKKLSHKYYTLNSFWLFHNYFQRLKRLWHHCGFGIHKMPQMMISEKKSLVCSNLTRKMKSLAKLFGSYVRTD
jgi:hypothetical protein